jgi:DNA-binding NarL/FixJ family response regulator
MTGDPAAAPPELLLVVDDAALEQLVRELLATVVPSASVTTASLANAPASEADLAIVDQAVRGLTGVTAVQELRARGYTGGIVLVAGACDRAIEQQLLALGPSRCVVRAALGTALPAALAELSARPDLGPELGPIEKELRRTQQLVAMGGATSRIQHTLNNPLTALLAEAQLLEMEELHAEHRAAVKRMIELCRRLVVMVRGLDSGTG